MKTFAVILLMGVGLSLPAFAGPIPYTISFTVSAAGDPLAPTGHFVYDPAAGFSDFLVQWAGVTFDLTPGANAPSISDPATGCAPTGGGHAYAMSIMTQSATGCEATYGWSAVSIGFVGYAQFGFSLNAVPYPSPSDGFNGGGLIPQDPLNNFVSMGSWSITADSAVPEPGTFCLMLLGALALAGVKKRQLASRHRATPGR